MQPAESVVPTNPSPSERPREDASSVRSSPSSRKKSPSRGRVRETKEHDIEIGHTAEYGLPPTITKLASTDPQLWHLQSGEIPSQSQEQQYPEDVRSVDRGYRHAAERSVRSVRSTGGRSLPGGFDEHYQFQGPLVGQQSGPQFGPQFWPQQAGPQFGPAGAPFQSNSGGPGAYDRRPQFYGHERRPQSAVGNRMPLQVNSSILSDRSGHH